MSRSPLKSAFTLIEVLIVVAIIALLVIALTLSMRSQRQKAEDARAKSDLERLKIAFEDYYSDNNCYPPPEWFDGPEDCGSSALQPYLNSITCDRRTGLPYPMEYDSAGCPSWYKLYTTLTFPDPDSPLCSDTGSTLGNYGVASSNTILSVVCTASPAPSSGSTPPPDPEALYYCQNLGNCSEIPTGWTCGITFSDGNCGGTPLCPAEKVSSCTPL